MSETATGRLLDAYVSPLGDEYRAIPRGEEGMDVEEPAPVETQQSLLSVKEGETFVCSDLDGDLSIPNTVGMGVYSKDPRFLSRLELRLNGAEPVLLSSSAERAHLSYVDLTNPDIWEGELIAIPAQTVNVRRMRAVAECVLERIRVKNYNAYPVNVMLEFALAADFLDIFEVRGLVRERRGRLFAPRVDGSTVKLAYLGVDEVFRETWITFSEAPATVRAVGGVVWVGFDLDLRAHQTRLLSLSVEPIIDGARRRRDDFNTALARTRHSYEDWE